jgi:predicted Zn-dependent protease
MTETAERHVTHGSKGANSRVEHLHRGIDRRRPPHRGKLAVSEQELIAMSLTEYKKFLDKNKISSDQTQTALVKKVGNRIATNMTTFFKTYQKGKFYERVKDYQWEFNLIQDNTVNAWCMPGGKVVVYTGLLAVTQSEEALAVVMGHEIAHAIARHGNERMSQQIKAQLGGIAVAVAVGSKPQETQDIFNAAYGIAGQLELLRYSRKHETEADKIGLVFMALAGYQPSAAIPFWERMAKASEGVAKPPEFLSTHPSDATRINELKAWMPEAMKYFKAAN